ncbi:hypothetical protein AB8302_004681 [Vibrio parahaemolyticus]
MSLVGEHQLREVTGISDSQTEAIKSFLQGAVYCWCKNRSQEDWFSLSELMGGENFYWEGTPLMSLYLKHEKNESENPVNQAGIDAGWLLKSVIASDLRYFETKKEFRKRMYRWCGEERT